MIFDLIVLAVFGFLGLIFFSIRYYIKEFSKEYSTDHFVTQYSPSYLTKGHLRKFKKYYRLSSRFIIKLERETFFTKILKSVGLVKEFQVKNKLFDDRFFILSDDPSTCNNLAKNEELQKEINSLYNTLEKEQIIFRYIKCNKGHLSIAINVKNDDKVEDEVDDYAKEIEPIVDKHMKAIKEILQDPYMFSEPQKFDKQYKNIKTVSKVLFAVSLVLLFYVVTKINASDYYYFERTPIIFQSILIGLGILGLYLNYLVRKFKATARFYELLILPSISIFLAISLSSYLFIYFENIFLDKSKSLKQTSKIVQKVYKEDTKSHKARFIFVIIDPIDKTKNLNMYVRAEKYVSKDVNDLIKFDVKKGYFGYRWISKVH